MHKILKNLWRLKDILPKQEQYQLVQFPRRSMEHIFIFLSFLLLVICYWLLVMCYWLCVIGYVLLVMCY